MNQRPTVDGVETVYAANVNDIDAKLAMISLLQSVMEMVRVDRRHELCSQPKIVRTYRL